MYEQLYIFISSFLLFCANQSYAQLDSIQQLEEVIINDIRLKEYSEGYQLIAISDTLMGRNPASLTDVLRYNSVIYFKENGYGMVSSPAFRGTNASQTAVIWNGIPINSNLTGQTDFNTISPNSYNDITIRSGGGSTQFGSGAVGGSIHLNNMMKFKRKQVNSFRLSYGSFSTFNGNIKTIQSNEKSYFDLGVDFISSENDYKYIGRDKKNENGEFLRLDISVNTGLRLKKSNLTWNTNYFLGDRNFSGTLTTFSKDTYKDITTRNLVSWKTRSVNLMSIVKVAHLFERYRYFPDKNKQLFFEGRSDTFLGDYQLEYQLNNNLKISSILNFTYIKAEGNNIGDNDRSTLAAVLLLNQRVTENFTYGLNIRQEFLNEFNNPFLISIDGKYKINAWYNLKFNASKNYRVPTFNDLFWEIGGNEDLEPEISYQAEIGNVFSWEEFELKLNGFYITSENLIKWQPAEDGLFSPVNISETENYGIELFVVYTRNINEHQFSINANYAYTSATDKEKNKQLIYVPFHKITGLLNYNFNRLTAYYQFYFNGEVFTTTDNFGTVDAYTISNIGVEYALNKNSFPITIGIKINNIFDTYYENVAYRPMPNRNFRTFINLKF